MKKAFITTNYLFFAILVVLPLIHIPSLALAWTPIAITRVIDGDTIAARIDGQGDEIRVRLYGIDAPEKKQPYGQAATQELRGMTQGAAEMEIYDKDRYGREVAVVRVSGVNINERMIATGYAWYYIKYCRASFCPAWRSLEEEARSAGRGLWASPSATPPWEWRHL